MQARWWLVLLLCLGSVVAHAQDAEIEIEDPTGYCGDGVCNYQDENCLTCHIDCSTTICNVCGDGYCDFTIGETCDSCSEDCGTCSFMTCEGVDGLCGENGFCNRGQCVCNDTWVGPTCEKDSTYPLDFDFSLTNPSVWLSAQVLEDDDLHRYLIQILTVEEINGTGWELEDPVNISEVEFNMTLTDYGTFFLYEYLTTLDNGARINVSIWQYLDSTPAEFVYTSAIYSPYSLRYHVTIHNWPFSSPANSLTVNMFFDSFSDLCVRPYEHVRSLALAIDGGQTSLYGVLADKALVDGRYRTITRYINNDTRLVSFLFPHFWDHAGTEAYFSVLASDPDVLKKCFVDEDWILLGMPWWKAILAGIVILPCGCWMVSCALFCMWVEHCWTSNYYRKPKDKDQPTDTTAESLSGEELEEGIVDWPPHED